MVRVNPLIAAADAWAPDAIAWVGVATALFAAGAAMAQNDIKKVLAYSTISQLGYMMLAVGTGAYVAAIFHMVTHAFFKALLFLGPVRSSTPSTATRTCAATGRCGPPCR